MAFHLVVSFAKFCFSSGFANILQVRWQHSVPYSLVFHAFDVLLWCLCLLSLECVLTSSTCVFWWLFLLVAVWSFSISMRCWWYPATLFPGCFLALVKKDLDWFHWRWCFQVSDTYKSTDFTLVLNNISLVFVLSAMLLHIGLKVE